MNNMQNNTLPGWTPQKIGATFCALFMDVARLVGAPVFFGAPTDDRFSRIERCFEVQLR